MIMANPSPFLRRWHVLSLMYGFAQILQNANAVPHPLRADYTITLTTENCDPSPSVFSNDVTQTHLLRETFHRQHRLPDLFAVAEGSWIGETNSANVWTSDPFSYPTFEPGPFDGVTWGTPLSTTHVSTASEHIASSTVTLKSQVTASDVLSSDSSIDAEPTETTASRISVTLITSTVTVSSDLSPTLNSSSPSSESSNGISTEATSDKGIETPLVSSFTITRSITTEITLTNPSNAQSSFGPPGLDSSASSNTIKISSASGLDLDTATKSTGISSGTDVGTSATSQSSPSESATTSEEVSRQTSLVSDSKTLSSTSSSDTDMATSALTRPVSSSSVLTAQPITTSLRLGSSAQSSSQPLSVSATSSLSLLETSSLASLLPTSASTAEGVTAPDIFQAVATDGPPAQISKRSDHPVPRLGIQQQSRRPETNKFYANFFLGSQSLPAWTHPYSVAWSKGGGATGSWGLAVMHTERDQLLGAGSKESWDAGEWGYLVNPTGQQAIILSAAELEDGTTLTTDSLEGFSVNVNLLTEGSNTPVLTFPLVQGMGFVTAVYDNGTPLLQSGLGIDSFAYVSTVGGGGTYKYKVQLSNGFTWLCYVTPQDLVFSTNSFNLNAGSVRGPSGFSGYIQVAKIPKSSDSAESVYDETAAVYPIAAKVSGSVTGSSGRYTISWTKGGNADSTLLMYALPHHVDSLSADTKAATTELQLVTTTKGIATAIRADAWTMVEADLPTDMSFAPWTQQAGDIRVVSSAAQDAIASAGNTELQQDIMSQTNTGSLYYDGKALAKFATICVTLYDIAGDKASALTGLATLKEAFAMHVNNEMPNPLVYDDAWGGAVSSASYGDGNLGDDFGNTVYNDHHFHFGYFVYAAAVIGYLDSEWIDEGTNKAWVNMLVRDYANPISDDAYYPFSRMFDWYHGHSWAHGLIETGDGKDQESSSEDTMSLYAIKMWGQVIGDTNMEARGNLMLSIQARSLQHYYLYLNNNDVEPTQFIGNKAAGILFENKIDHITYFGNEVEYIEGIHMLPLMPCSTLTRTPQFVQQEWDTYFSDSGIRPAGDVTGGWKGVIMANYAIIDPQTSYDYFTGIAQDELDGGASQTWYLAFAAALAENSTAAKERRDFGDQPASRANQGEKVSREVSHRVRPRHHGDAYKLRSDGVGMPGAEVELPSDETLRKDVHHRMARRNHGDGYAKHELTTNTINGTDTTTATAETAAKMRGSSRSSRLRQRTRGGMRQA
nr:putative endo-1,3(4)-beta-glucanase [Quercus suber]